MERCNARRVQLKLGEQRVGSHAMTHTLQDYWSQIVIQGNKFHFDGSINKYKVCFAAKGNAQREGEDFHKTYGTLLYHPHCSCSCIK